MTEKVVSTYRDGWQVRQEFGGPVGERAVLYDSFDRPHHTFMEPLMSVWTPNPATRWFAWARHSSYARVRAAYYLHAGLFGWLVSSAIIYRSVGYFLAASLAAISFSITGTLFHKRMKEARNGRNRRAEADHRDPQAGGTADPGGAAGTASAGTGLAVTAADLARLTIHTKTSTNVGPQMAPAIDTVHEDMPILAHRAARLVGGRGGMKLAALNRRDGNSKLLTFGVDEDAKCGCVDEEAIYRHSMRMAMSYSSSSRLSHSFSRACDPVPSLHGDCGWYAVPADVDAWHDDTTIDLLVELSGRVIEHEKGYRAEHQRVMEIHVPGCCYCGGRSEIAVFNSESAQLAGFTCGQCKPIGGNVSLVPVDAIERCLDVPVVHR